MQNNDWMSETIPTSREELAAPGEESAPTGLAAVPVFVWVLGFIALFTMLLLCGLWGVYLMRGEPGAGGATPTPIFLTATTAPSPTALPTGTPEPSPTASPDIAVGRYVRVAGTEGYGVSLRSGPGADYTRMDVALDGEVFLVVEGPTVTAGAEWYKIRDPDNEEREWWAIGNFLEPVEHP